MASKKSRMKKVGSLSQPAKKAGRKGVASKKSAAKKSTKTPIKKAAKKPVIKAAKKNAAPKRDPLAPRNITTGKGPTPAEVGASLVDMFNRGLLKEIEQIWWSPSITSIEGMGQAWDGKRAVDGKNEWWLQTNRMIRGTAEGPYVGATGFAVKFHLEVEEITTGQLIVMDEIGVYTVKDGKIVQEEFMYGGVPGA